MRTKAIAFIGLFLSLQVGAADSPQQVQVNWQQPEKYTDIRPSNSTRKAYQNRVLKAFDKIWADVAKNLPAGYQLAITVKDLDLAGDVNPLYRIDNNDIRVVKDIYFPRMTIDYRLTDAAGQQLDAGTDVKIKDSSFMSTQPTGFRSDEFAYEKRMLKDWYRKTIDAKLNPAK